MASPDGRLTHPALFPCADRVSVPQVGADETKLKALNPIDLLDLGLPFGRPAQVKENWQRNYLKRVSADLVFSNDVIKIHAAHTLPYNRDDIHQTFRSSDVVQRDSKRGTTGPTGRHNPRGADKKHLPCHIKTVSQHHLKPLHRKPKPKAIESDLIENDKKTTESSSSTNVITKSDSPIFLTQRPYSSAEREAGFSASKIRPKKKSSSSENWDEYLLKHLSKNTARWIINEKTLDGPRKDRLHRLVTDMYGLPTHPIDTLIRDDASDITDVQDPKQVGQWSNMKLKVKASAHFKPSKSKKKTKRKMKGDAVVADEDDDSCEDEDEDDEEDEDKIPLASFYKTPGGIRKQQKQLDKKLAGMCS